MTATLVDVEHSVPIYLRQPEDRYWPSYGVKEYGPFMVEFNNREDSQPDYSVETLTLKQKQVHGEYLPLFYCQTVKVSENIQKLSRPKSKLNPFSASSNNEIIFTSLFY